MYSLQTSPDSLSATSSLASADGPLQLDWLDGPTPANSGRAPAPANHSALPGLARASQMRATCGPSSSASSESAAPKPSWVSRLQQRLEKNGSLQSIATWTESTTTSGLLLSRLTLSEPSIAGSGSGLLPTPSGTSNRGKNHVAGRLDEWGGSSNPFRGTPLGGVHSPAFELWMMGYPATWRQLMPPAMPSSRKSRQK